MDKDEQPTNNNEDLAQQISALREQVTQLVEQTKAKEPTERDALTAQLQEARAKKDFDSVVALSNQLAELEE